MLLLRPPPYGCTSSSYKQCCNQCCCCFHQSFPPTVILFFDQLLLHRLPDMHHCCKRCFRTYPVLVANVAYAALLYLITLSDVCCSFRPPFLTLLLLLLIVLITVDNTNLEKKCWANPV